MLVVGKARKAHTGVVGFFAGLVDEQAFSRYFRYVCIKVVSNNLSPILSAFLQATRPEDART